MPSIPVYDSRRQIQARPHAPKQIGGGEVLEGVQTVLQTTSEAMQQMQDANDVMEYTSSKKEHGLALEQIKANALADPDYKNSKNYLDEISALREKSLSGVTNPSVAQRLGIDFDYSEGIATINIESAAKEKQIVDHQLNMQDEVRSLYSNSVIATTPAEAQKYSMEAQQLMDVSIQTGLISREDAKELKKSAKEEIILQYAETDVDKAIALLNESKGDFTAKERSEILTSAKSIAQTRQKEFELAQEQRYSTNQSQIYSAISEPGTYIDKMNLIQEKLSVGAIDEKIAETSKKYLMSQKRVEAKTYNEDFAQVMNMIGDLQTTFNQDSDDKDAKQYLKKERDARNHIMKLRTNGRLTESDEKALLKKIDKEQYSEKRKSAELLKESGSAFHWGYDNAKKEIFDKELTNTALSNEAMRRYFYDLEKNPDMKESDKKSLARKITADLNNTKIQQALVQSEGDKKVIGGVTYIKNEAGQWARE